MKELGLEEVRELLSTTYDDGTTLFGWRKICKDVSDRVVIIKI